MIEGETAGGLKFPEGNTRGQLGLNATWLPKSFHNQHKFSQKRLHILNVNIYVDSYLVIMT